MMPKTKPGILTAMKTKFVSAFAGNATEAAEKSGSRRPRQTGYDFMKDPAVLEAIAKKQAAMAQQSGKDLGKRIKITRNDIINGLSGIAEHGESESARVTAYGKLADIFGLMPKPSGKDVDIFAGWSDEELLHYRQTGELPSRFGPSAEDDGKPIPNPALPSTG
jgi:hypothetical protein